MVAWRGWSRASGEHGPVSTVRRLSVDDAPVRPWRNGRGETRELLVLPREGDPWLRLSLASITGPGPFSRFDGFERVLVSLGPGDLRLEHGDTAPPARPRPLEPYRFSGDWTTHAAAGTGELDAFNVFARRDALVVSVEPVRLGRRRMVEDLAAPWTVLFVTDGRLTARVSDEEEPFELEGGELLCIEDPRPGDTLELQGTDAEAEALLVMAAPRR